MELYSFDQAYVRRLREGDAETQQHFVSYFSELLALKLRARFFPSHVIDDIRQETFTRVLALLQRDRSLSNAERLGAFVNSVCNNVVLEHYRTGKTAAPLTQDALFEDTDLASRRARVDIEDALRELHEYDRKALLSVFLEEKDKTEVCNELGIDREQLDALIHRAKLLFRAAFEKEFERSARQTESPSANPHQK